MAFNNISSERSATPEIATNPQARQVTQESVTPKAGSVSTPSGDLQIEPVSGVQLSLVPGRPDLVPPASEVLFAPVVSAPPSAFPVPVAAELTSVTESTTTTTTTTTTLLVPTTAGVPDSANANEQDEAPSRSKTTNSTDKDTGSKTQNPSRRKKTYAPRSARPAREELTTTTSTTSTATTTSTTSTTSPTSSTNATTRSSSSARSTTSSTSGSKGPGSRKIRREKPEGGKNDIGRHSHQEEDAENVSREPLETQPTQAALKNPVSPIPKVAFKCYTDMAECLRALGACECDLDKLAKNSDWKTALATVLCNKKLPINIGIANNWETYFQFTETVSVDLLYVASQALEGIGLHGAAANLLGDAACWQGFTEPQREGLIKYCVYVVEKFPMARLEIFKMIKAALQLNKSTKKLVDVTDDEYLSKYAHVLEAFGNFRAMVHFLESADGLPEKYAIACTFPTMTYLYVYRNIGKQLASTCLDEMLSYCAGFPKWALFNIQCTCEIIGDKEEKSVQVRKSAAEQSADVRTKKRKIVPSDSDLKAALKKLEDDSLKAQINKGIFDLTKLGAASFTENDAVNYLHYLLIRVRHPMGIPSSGFEFLVNLYLHKVSSDQFNVTKLAEIFVDFLNHSTRNLEEIDRLFAYFTRFADSEKNSASEKSPVVRNLMTSEVISHVVGTVVIHCVNDALRKKDMDRVEKMLSEKIDGKLTLRKLFTNAMKDEALFPVLEKTLTSACMFVVKQGNAALFENMAACLNLQAQSYVPLLKRLLQILRDENPDVAMLKAVLVVIDKINVVIDGQLKSAMLAKAKEDQLSLIRHSNSIQSTLAMLIARKPIVDLKLTPMLQTLCPHAFNTDSHAARAARIAEAINALDENPKFVPSIRNPNDPRDLNEHEMRLAVEWIRSARLQQADMGRIVDFLAEIFADRDDCIRCIRAAFGDSTHDIREFCVAVLEGRARLELPAQVLLMASALYVAVKKCSDSFVKDLFNVMIDISNSWDQWTQSKFVFFGNRVILIQLISCKPPDIKMCCERYAAVSIEFLILKQVSKRSGQQAHINAVVKMESQWKELTEKIKEIAGNDPAYQAAVSNVRYWSVPF